jgi:predicted ArsR family transcriptional regulator
MSRDPSPTYAALASPVRRKILDLLRAGPGGDATCLDALALAEATGLHVTTIRFHLGVLRRAGLVVSKTQPPRTTGRPRLGFTAAADALAWSGREPYLTLAALLAGWFDTMPAASPSRAEQIGVGWSKDLLARQPRRGSTGETARTVVAIFADLGFAPRHLRDGDGHRIELRACPFLAVALEHPDVVCALHRGLLRGVVEAVGAAGTRSDLDSLVEPDLCIARLEPPTPASRRTG